MSTEQQELPRPSEMSKKYKQNIATNLQKILDATGVSQNALVEIMKKRGLEINQGTFSKYLKGTVTIQFSVIVMLCDIFEIDISDFVREDFQYTSHNIPTETVALQNMNRDGAALYIPKLGDKFISNPTDRGFFGYKQDYHCYFFPTLSGESKLLTGTLSLYERQSVCEASLKLNTNKLSGGNPIYKTYTGCAVISNSVNSLYIILSSSEEGEICVINCRHFFIRHQSLDCRMAEVITNGAGEGHPPTIHRMLISRDSIDDKHLPLITPHLYLNSSDILIRRDEIQSLRDESEAYQKLIDHLLHMVDPIEIYSLKEDYVRSNATQFLSKPEIRVFLSKIRDHSSKVRYNKVSKKVDETVHKLLISLGYYRGNDLCERQ